jgi:sensor histidine kinase YesM
MNKISVKLLLIISLFANQVMAKADTLRLTDDKNFNIYQSSEVLLSSRSHTIEKIRTEKNWQTRTADLTIPKNTAFWLHFFVENHTDKTQQIFIRNPDNEISEYYVFEDKKIVNKQVNGTFVSTLGMNENQLVGVDSFSLPSKKTIEFYIKTYNYDGLLPFLRLFPQKPLRTSYYLKTEKQHSLWLNQYYIHNINELQVKSFFLGGLGVIFIIILLVLFQNRAEKLYKFYVLYVLSGLCYALLKSRNFAYIGKFIGYVPVIKIYGTELVMCWGVAAYFIFIAELLDLRKNHQKLYLFIRKTSRILFYYGLTVFLWMFLSNDSGLESKIYTITRVILCIMYFMILALTSQKVKSTMVKYILLSNLILVTFGCIAWLKTSVYNDVNWYGIFNHLFTLPFAILLEIIVFILAIAKKVGDDRQAKNALEKNAMEIEMMALRSQMNPHFVFNSLNTVRYFVLSDQKEKAKNYLAKFSKLLRTILTYSKENTISLSNELEAIRLYLDVESGRFESNFFYSIKIDEQIDLDSVMIPPLLLQPFAENAIIHGLRNSEKNEKILNIKVSQTSEERLEISITDNGIGRTESNKMQHNQDVLHKSFGTTITNQRIELFNQSYANKIKVETTDLNNESGTEVLIQISI